MRRRKKFPQLRVEVEVTSLVGLQNVCKESHADMVLLDNFDARRLRESVKWCEEFFASAKDRSRPLLEASGGITMETLVAIAETGVDRISVGALTHSVGTLDISLEIIF